MFWYVVLAILILAIGVSFKVIFFVMFVINFFIKGGSSK